MPSQRMEERLRQRVEHELGGREPKRSFVPVVILPMLFILLVATVMVLRARPPLPLGRSGTTVYNVKTGMTYDEVVDAAGPPLRSEPANAIDTRPAAAVLYYQGDNKVPVRVFMTGNVVSSLESAPGAPLAP